MVHNGKVYGLQNITDQQDELTAVADDRRVIVFNGERWLWYFWFYNARRYLYILMQESQSNKKKYKEVSKGKK